MAKSLFDNKEQIPLTIEEIKKIHMIKEKSDVPSLLPEDDRKDEVYTKEENTIPDYTPYSDNSPQVFIDNKKIPEGIQTSGSFFIRGEELFADIRLEFNVKHPKYGIYIKRLKNFVKECEDEHVLLSSSGI